MRFNKKPLKQAISEWKDIYIDYNFLKILINSIQTITDQNKQLHQRHQVTNGFISHNDSHEAFSAIVPGNVTNQYTSLMLAVKKHSQQINGMFNYVYEQKAALFMQFCKVKFQEIQYRQMLSVLFAKTATHEEIVSYLVPYIQYNYIEASYLTRMVENNLDDERKILKRHLKHSKGIIPTHPQILSKSLNPSLKMLDDVVQRIQNIYIQKTYSLDTNKNKKPKQKRDYLRSLATNVSTPHYQTFSTGVFVGMFFAVVVFLSLLLFYKNKSVETDPIFKRDFPTWRGIAIIILYMWIMGLNVYYYQEYKISHFLALNFTEHRWLTAIRIFKLSGVFSTMYVILFSIYVLNLSEIINLHSFSPKYLVLIIWVAFILFIVNPFPFMYHKTRRYIFKHFVKIPSSLCVGVTFITGFIVSQFMSLVVPFQDFAYTICYFTYMDFSVVDKVNICKKPAKITVFIFVQLILIYKLIQYTKQGLQKGRFLFEAEFYLALRYIFVIISTILSFIYTEGDSLIILIWFIFTVLSTIIFFITDVVYDWELGDCNSYNYMLRDKISYPKRMYYFIIGTNLFLRLLWVMTLCPSIAIVYFQNPQLFRLFAGSIQILRRGNWNIMKIQKPHLQNCEKFRAISQRRDILQNKIKQRINESKQSQKSINIDQFKIVYNPQNQYRDYENIRIKVDQLQHNFRVIESQLDFKLKEVRQLQKILRAIV